MTRTSRTRRPRGPRPESRGPLGVHAGGGPTHTHAHASGDGSASRFSGPKLQASDPRVRRAPSSNHGIHSSNFPFFPTDSCGGGDVVAPGREATTRTTTGGRGRPTDGVPQRSGLACDRSPPLPRETSDLARELDHTTPTASRSSGAASEPREGHFDDEAIGALRTRHRRAQGARHRAHRHDLPLRAATLAGGARGWRTRRRRITSSATSRASSTPTATACWWLTINEPVDAGLQELPDRAVAAGQSPTARPQFRSCATCCARTSRPTA